MRTFSAPSYKNRLYFLNVMKIVHRILVRLLTLIISYRIV